MPDIHKPNTDLLGHYESQLDFCVRRWINDPHDPQKSLADVSGLTEQDIYQVLKFERQPIRSAKTFVTYGLSRHVLDAHTLQLTQAREVRIELLACVNEAIPDAAVVYLLMSFGNAILRRRQAPVNGEIINWQTTIFEEPRFRYLYCTEPLLFPSELAVFGGSSPETVIVWLFPVTEAEAMFAINVGFERFNSLLRAEHPDIFAFDRRAELPLPGQQQT